MPIEPVRIYAPRGRMLLLLLASLGFVAGGAWMVASGDVAGIVIGVVSVAFFGVGVFYFLRELVWRRPTLQIDADGIVDRSSLAAAGRLSWRDVQAVHLYAVGRQRMLGILPRDPERQAERAADGSRVRRLSYRANAGLGYDPINIPQISVPFPLERLIEEMRRHNPTLEVITEPEPGADPDPAP